jgi:hypothetical protein
MFVCPECSSNEWGTGLNNGYCHGKSCTFTWARSPEKDRELGIVPFSSEADTVKLTTVPPKKDA